MGEYQDRTTKVYKKEELKKWKETINENINKLKEKKKLIEKLLKLFK